MKKLTLSIGGHQLSNDDLIHLQNALISNSAETIKSDLPSGVNKCVLWGCQVTENGDDYTMSSGAIYYEGEIYPVDAISSPLTDSGTPKFGITTTYPDNNPVTYESGDSYYVHGDRRMSLLVSTNTSGLFEYDDIVDKKWLLWSSLAPSGTTLEIKSNDPSSLFNLTTGASITDRWAGWVFDLDSTGKVIVGYDPDDSDFNTADGSKSGGDKSVTLTSVQSGLPTHEHDHQGAVAVDVSPTSGVFCKTNLRLGQSNPVYGGEPAGGLDHPAEAPHTNMQPYVVYLRVVKI